MKLATIDNGTPDGTAVVVSDDLSSCARLGMSMQQVLDRWDEVEWPEPAAPFDIAEALAPLPRAVQFLDGSAYVNHVELVRRARGAEMPERFWTDPLMYQGCSAPCLSATAPIATDPDWGTDFEAEVAVVTGFVPRGVSVARAGEAVRLVMLLNDVSLRALIPDELSKGFGFVQSKPPSAFSPIAVTPDALPGWAEGRLSGRVCVNLNDEAFGRAEAGADMTFGFPELIAHAAKTRDLPAGTIIGSGTVSNKLNGGPGKPVAEGGAGYSCIAEQRMVETIERGAAATPFLKGGDRVRIWMEDDGGRSVFGDIDQGVVPA
ncbi:fumarylacetoacetate hydrolase family protein [Aestuariibius sp. 2305UL40-4]|uniref:fumarylacetoacetate hydrolase family protein n=1 Tax=Aestuariibius violaceus TaxID=3234132 RepID=UPI00345EF0BC